jgi:hypothetical protein
MLFDYNANNIAQGNNTNITTLLDDSGNNNTATGGGSMKYKATGFGGLNYPYMDITNTAGCGFTCPHQGHSGDEAVYILIEIISATGTTTDSSTLYNAPGGSGEQGAFYARADGTLYASAGNSFFGWPQAGGTNVVAGTGIHILRFTVSHGAGAVKAFVDGVQEISFSNALIVNGWSSATRYFFNAGGSGLVAKVHSVQRWSASHSTAGINAIEDAMLARIGM